MKDRLINLISVSPYEELSVRTGIRSGKCAVILSTDRIRGKKKHREIKLRRDLLPQLIAALELIE